MKCVPEWSEALFLLLSPNLFLSHSSGLLSASLIQGLDLLLGLLNLLQRKVATARADANVSAFAETRSAVSGFWAVGSWGFGCICNLDLPLTGTVTLGKFVNDPLSLVLSGNPYYAPYWTCGPTQSFNLYILHFPNCNVVTKCRFCAWPAVRINCMIIPRSSFQNKIIKYYPCLCTTMLFGDGSCYKEINDRKVTFPLFLFLQEKEKKIQTLSSSFWDYRNSWDKDYSWGRNGQVFLRGFLRGKIVSIKDASKV